MLNVAQSNPLTLKTFSALPTYMVNICAMFHLVWWYYMAATTDGGINKQPQTSP